MISPRQKISSKPSKTIWLIVKTPPIVIVNMFIDLPPGLDIVRADLYTRRGRGRGEARELVSHHRRSDNCVRWICCCTCSSSCQAGWYTRRASCRAESSTCPRDYLWTCLRLTPPPSPSPSRLNVRSIGYLQVSGLKAVWPLFTHSFERRKTVKT